MALRTMLVLLCCGAVVIGARPQVRAKIAARDAAPGDEFDLRANFRRNVLCDVQPGPNRALADAQQPGQFALRPRPINGLLQGLFSEFFALHH